MQLFQRIATALTIGFDRAVQWLAGPFSSDTNSVRPLRLPAKRQITMRLRQLRGRAADQRIRRVTRGSNRHH